MFAWPMGRLVVEPGAALVAVVGRVVVVLVDGVSDAREAARLVEPSAAGRVVRGRFAVVVVVVEEEGARDGRDVALPGEARAAAPGTCGVLRTTVRLCSSAEVTDDSSGSASDEVDLPTRPARLVAVPGAGRVGGLFRLDPTVLRREVALDSGLDAVVDVDGRVLVEDAAGRRAPAGAVPPVVVGRRGGTGSLEASEGAFEAILRRTDDVGVEGAGSFLGCGLAGTLEAREGAVMPAASLAGEGASIWGQGQWLAEMDGEEELQSKPTFPGSLEAVTR